MLELIKDLFRGPPKASPDILAPAREPKTHDFRDNAQCNGHAIDSWIRLDERGIRAEVNGWARGLQNGDYILTNNAHGETRYRFTRLRYYPCKNPGLEPDDMWEGEVEFAPRQAPVL